MTVEGLIEELERYPKDASVEICTPWGSFEVSNLNSEASMPEGEEIVLIVTEEEPLPPETYAYNIMLES